MMQTAAKTAKTPMEVSIRVAFPRDPLPLPACAPIAWESMPWRSREKLRPILIFRGITARFSRFSHGLFLTIYMTQTRMYGFGLMATLVVLAVLMMARENRCRRPAGQLSTHTSPLVTICRISAQQEIVAEVRCGLPWTVEPEFWRSPHPASPLPRDPQSNGLRSS